MVDKISIHRINDLSNDQIVPAGSDQSSGMARQADSSNNNRGHTVSASF